MNDYFCILIDFLYEILILVYIFAMFLTMNGWLLIIYC